MTIISPPRRFVRRFVRRPTEYGFDPVVTVVTFEAPSEFTWDGVTSDASPGFTVVYDIRSEAGDEIELDYDTVDTFDGADYVTYSYFLLQADIDGGTLNVPITDLTSGNWYARVRQRRGTDPWSDYSNLAFIVLSLGDRLLMEDGVSYYLMEDGSSFYLLDP